MTNQASHERLDTQTRTSKDMLVQHRYLDSQPFTKAMDELVQSPSPHYMVSKIIPFLGSGDLEAHLKAFRTHMLI